MRSHTQERYELQAGLTSISPQCSETILCGATSTSTAIGSDQRFLWLPDLETVANGAAIIRIGGPLSRLHLPKYKKHTAGSLCNQATALTSLSLPELTTISGGLLIQNCHSLKNLELPALTTISGGSIIYGRTSLTELVLPALETINGGYVLQGALSVSDLILPAMTEVKEGVNAQLWDGTATAADRNIYLPNFVRAANRMVLFHSTTPGNAHVYMLSCAYFDGIVVSNSRDLHVHMHFGSDIKFIRAEEAGGAADNIIYLHIAPGAKTAVRANTILDPESMHAFIVNLGDNTGGETLQLQIGAANIAALSQEDIEMATSKNYTLS